MFIDNKTGIMTKITVIMFIVVLTLTLSGCKNEPELPPVPVIAISLQPVKTLNVTAGSITGSLSVIADVTEGAELNYQWYINNKANISGGTIIRGATSASYKIPTSLIAGTYYYFCEVTAAEAEPVRSNVATVHVAAPAPVITINTQPVITTNVIQGSISGSLSVSASVTRGVALTYQWYSNTSAGNSGGSVIEGAENASFTIPKDLAGGTYFYFVEVMAAGAKPIRSNTATVNVSVSVVPLITIITQPAATTYVTQGSISGSLSVSASVTQGAALSYQWYSNTTDSNSGGSILSGATSENYTIPTGLTAGTYYYFCEVMAAGADSVRSTVATVIVSAPAPVISINTQPAATTNVTQGSISGSLSVSASVTQGAALTYQWYSNTTASNIGGTVIGGATSASYAIPTSLTAGNYYYFVEVGAIGAESVRSSVATVNVSAPAPVITITTQPAVTTNVTQGSITGSLSVSANVTQGAALSYQWYSNTTASNIGGTVIGGATSASFVIPTSLTAGAYYYFCEVMAAGAVSVRSNAATVNVITPVITINTQPAATTNVTQGSISGSLSVSASVTQGVPLTYQWYSNTTDSNSGGSVISGATGVSYTIPTSLTAGTYFYFVEVRAIGAESVRSSVATVNVIAPVITINIQPAETTNVLAGKITGSLSVSASVTQGVTLTYQWYSNTTDSNSGGSVINDETSASYTIPASLTAGTYYYFCEVMATGADSVRSNVATVTVRLPVPVTGVTLNETLIILSLGETRTLIATVEPFDADIQNAFWQSNFPNVASVDETGMITANAVGTAYVTFYIDGQLESCKVVVIDNNRFFPEWNPYPYEYIGRGFVGCTGIVWGGPAGQEKFVAIGRYGSDYTSIAYSEDGLNWTFINKNLVGGYYNYNYLIKWVGPPSGSGRRFFVADNSTQRQSYSINGTSWTDVTISSGIINDITWGNNYYIAVGGSGLIRYSTNMTSWTSVSSSPFNNAINGIAFGGAAGNEVFVAVGDNGKMGRSVNGTTWSSVSSTQFGDTDTIRSIIWGGPAGQEKFVAVGDNGIAYSTNGTNWTKALSGSTFYSIAWGGPAGNEVFIAGGTQRVMMYSKDAVTWTSVPNQPINLFGYGISIGDIRGFAWGGPAGGKRFIAVNDNANNIAHSVFEE